MMRLSADCAMLASLLMALCTAVSAQPPQPPPDDPRQLVHGQPKPASEPVTGFDYTAYQGHQRAGLGVAARCPLRLQCWGW